MKRCDKCGRDRSDAGPGEDLNVRFDPGTHMTLCDQCWFHTNPMVEGPKNRKPRPGH